MILSNSNGATTSIIKDGDNTVIQTISDVSKVMERAKAARNARSNFNPGDDHTLAAVIPLTLLEQFAQERGISMHEAMNDDTIIARCIAANPDTKAIDKWVF